MIASEFFDWWRSQLTSLLPESLRSNWRRQGRTASLRIEGDTVSLVPAQGDSAVSLSLASRADPGADGGSGQNVFPIGDDVQNLAVVLAPGEYLLSEFTLPRAAQAHLAEAVGYQLPKLIPFRTDEVVYACGIADNARSDGPLPVWLVAVPRRKLTAALALIGQTAPHKPLSLKTRPAAGADLALTWRIADKALAAQRNSRLLWAGLAMVWLAAIGLHFHNRYATHEALSAEADDLRVRAAEITGTRERLGEMALQVAWLHDKKDAAVSTLEVLDALTRQLDDDTWLQNLELKGRELSIQGLSPSPAGLIERLDDAALLNDVQFEAAITQDVRTGGSRFSIGARVQPQVREDGS